MIKPSPATRHRRRTGAGSLLVLPIALIAALLCACTPADPIEQVRALHEEGRFADSLDPLRELLEQRPEDPEVHYLYGVALRSTGQPSLSLWSLRKASRSPGWEVPAGLELASSAYQSGNHPAAIEEADRVLEIEPDNTQALRLRAEARLADRNELEAALADLDRLLELDPENLEVRVSRAVALLSMKRVDEAEEALGALEDLAASRHLDPEARAPYCVARATFAKERGDMKLAEERFEACLEEYPDDGTVIEEAIVFFDGRGRPERSTELLRGVVESRPEAVALRDVLARRLRASGDVEGAEEVLRGGTELEQPALAAFAWRSLADHFIALERNEEAVVALERALEVDENPSQQLLLAYADLLTAAGQYDRALEVANDLEQEAFRDLVRARVFLEQRKPREAIERFESAVRFWPDNAAARYYTARAAEALGDFDRATEEYRQSIRAGAEYTDAAKRLAELYDAEGAPRLALGAAAHQSKAHGETPDALLLELGLRMQTGEAKRVRAILEKLRRPRTWARALAFVSEETAERQGPEVAVKMLREDPHLDLTHPRDVAALRALVRHLVAAGSSGEALAAADAALAAHPDFAAFHALRGFALEERGAAPAEVRAAYERAAALDGEEALALSGLARLSAAEGDVDAALGLYDRAASLDPEDSAPRLAAAGLAARSGRGDEAKRRLEDVLWDHPYDARAALQLAEVILDQEEPDHARVQALLRRADRFGAAAEADALRERLSPAVRAEG